MKARLSLSVLLAASLPLLAQTSKPSSTPPPAQAAAESPAPPKPVFQTFHSAASGFSVDAPGKLIESVQQTPTKLGPIEVHAFLLDLGASGALMVMCNEFPADHSYDPPKVLDGALKGGVDSFKGRIDWQHPLNLNGTPGVEARLLSDKFVVQIRIYLAGRRLYQLMVIAPLGQDLPQGSTRFFDSFQFEP